MTFIHGIFHSAYLHYLQVTHRFVEENKVNLKSKKARHSRLYYYHTENIMLVISIKNGSDNKLKTKTVNADHH